MKDIKQYLHLYLYLGCEVGIKNSGGVIQRYYLRGVKPKFSERERKDVVQVLCEPVEDDSPLSEPSVSFWNWSDECKLILRPLITATGHETENAILPLISAINSLNAEGLNEKKIMQCAELTRYLLSKHFDLFGLIESNLALDKSKLP